MRAICCGLVLVWLSVLPVMASKQVVKYRYFEQLGDETYMSNWIETVAGNRRVIEGDTIGARLYFEGKIGQMNMSEWSAVRKDGTATVNVQREGESLALVGTRNGEVVKTSLALEDGLPWIASVGFFIAPFTQDETVDWMAFWFVTPGKWELMKMQLFRQEDVTIKIRDRAYEAIHISMRPSGFFAVLWKADMWFRKSDGHFLKYTGLVGLPGSERYTVEYIE